MMCVTTRFQLKHVWALAPMYIMYKKMRRDLKAAPGLVRFAFLVESPRVCFTLSVWESESAIVDFSNVPSHIDAVRGAHAWCRQIWSAYWKLDGISRHAQSWEGTAEWPALVRHPELAHRLIDPRTFAPAP